LPARRSKAAGWSIWPLEPGRPAARRLAPESRAELDESAWLLAAELGGPAPAVERAAREIVHLATAAGSPRVTEVEDGHRVTFMRRLRDHGRTPEERAALILRVGVLPSDAPLAARALATSGGDVPPAVIVRAGSGVVYGYWERCADPAVVVRAVRAGIERLGGALVVERAPVQAKAGLDVWGIAGPDVALMRRVKDAYDPGGSLSPGRLV
jgi:FAD/FMN-containing dehydrogenase